MLYSTQITFDELPGAVSSLVKSVADLTNEVRELRAELASERINRKSDSRFIGMEDACRILGKKRPTVYVLARDGKIPAYKVPGEKGWRFVESELIDHVKENKRPSSIMTFAQMEEEISRGTRGKSLRSR